MRGGSAREVVDHFRSLYRLGVSGSFSDEQLLDRFLARRDEAGDEAFAELVRRHGPMVLGVCQRILGDAHDAEDAFQATFLVLARKAASVVRREKVASWLYGVAVRTARDARGRAARRRAREDRVRAPDRIEPPDEDFPAELCEILDEEIARLPAALRGAVVLCELEGLSRPDAARRMGIPEGTLSSRLARARARLRDRLARRGVAVPIAAISAALFVEAQAAPISLALLESTVQAAALVAAGPTLAAAATAAISAPVASLSEGVIHTMFLAKLKGVALAVGTMTAIVSGAVVLGQSGEPGSGSGASRGNGQAQTRSAVLYGDVVVKPITPGGEQPNDEKARAAALEKKLDRILEALEHLSARGQKLPQNWEDDLIGAGVQTRRSSSRPDVPRDNAPSATHALRQGQTTTPTESAVEEPRAVVRGPSGSAEFVSVNEARVNRAPVAQRDNEVPQSPEGTVGVPIDLSPIRRNPGNMPDTQPSALRPEPVVGNLPDAVPQPPDRNNGRPSGNDDPTLTSLPAQPVGAVQEPAPYSPHVSAPQQVSARQQGPATAPSPVAANPGQDNPSPTQPASNQPQYRPPLGPPTAQGPAPPSISDRLQALEREMEHVTKMLARLDGKLNELDARVGGGNGQPQKPPVDRW